MSKSMTFKFMSLLSIFVFEALADNQSNLTSKFECTKKRKIFISSKCSDSNTTAIYDKDGNMFHEDDYRKSMKGDK